MHSQMTFLSCMTAAIVSVLSSHELFALVCDFQDGLFGDMRPFLHLPWPKKHKLRAMWTHAHQSSYTEDDAVASTWLATNADLTRLPRLLDGIPSAAIPLLLFSARAGHLALFLKLHQHQVPTCVPELYYDDLSGRRRYMDIVRATCLVEAMRGNHLEVTKLAHDLCLLGRNLVRPRSWLGFGLQLAADNGHVDAVAYATTFHVDVRHVRKAIRVAAARGHIAVVQQLYPLDPHPSRAAATIAAQHGHLDVVQWILTTHSVATAWAPFLLRRSAVARQPHVLAWLLEFDPTMDIDHDVVVQIAATGDVELFKAIFKDNAHADRSIQGASRQATAGRALVRAAAAGHAGMVHYLLTDLFQDLDDVNIDGRDLMDAIARRHDTIIAMLVAVTHVTVGDDCVIQVAASGNVALLQTLVTATTIRLADRHVTAETALRRATANGHTDMMEYLLTDLFQGIETTHLSSADVQAAVANGHEATLTSLFHGTHVTVDHDCVINVAGTGNLTLLQTLVTTTTINIDDRHAVASMAVGRAAASGHTDMVHYLLAELFHDVKCVAIAAGDLMAIASRHVPTLSMLVDATHVTVDDDCVIQVAAVGNVALLQTLVTAATIRLADGQATAGRALGHAAVGRHQAMVQYLLSDFFSN
ncbi:hypothetical protein As57867_006839, partial [Aphanomyces stellatus]